MLWFLLLLMMLALGGCAGQITEFGNARATEMFIAPTATAAAIANRENEIRVTAIAAEKAQLELERDQALQSLSLAQQADQQVEEHARQMAVISTTYAYSLSLINQEYLSRTALISANLSVTLNDAEAGKLERISQAHGQQALNTGLGIGGLLLAIFVGLGVSIFAVLHAAKKGREVRPDARTGRLPQLFLGWFWMNPNKTSASALMLDRPGMMDKRRAWRLFEQGKITVQEFRALTEPRVKQVGDPQLELAAAHSADQRDMFISGTWNMEGRLDGPRKSLTDRLTEIGKGIAHLKDRLLPPGSIPPARMLTVSKDEIRQFQSSMFGDDPAE
jgi:hypothetical protein